MKEVEYVPQCLMKENAILEGKIKLKLPTFSERMSYIEQCNFELKQDGTIDLSINKLGPVGKLVSISKQHYLSVDLRAKDGSKELKSFEDLELDADCDELLVEVAGLLLNGFRPSKN